LPGENHGKDLSFLRRLPIWVEEEFEKRRKRSIRELRGEPLKKSDMKSERDVY